MRAPVLVVSALSLLFLAAASENPRVDPGTSISPKLPTPGVLLRPFDGGDSWMQFNAAPELSTRSNITAATVARMTLGWRIQLPEVADGSPLYVNDAPLASGPKDVVIIQTKTGRVLAINARSGILLWQTTPPAGPRWTTSSPVVDPSRNFVYAYGLDGYIHKYAMADGSEITGDGWPELVTLKGDVEKGSSALSLAKAKDGHTYLYMTIAAYPEPGDDGDYQGHLVTVDLDSGHQNIFNVACSDMAMHFVEYGDATNDCNVAQGGVWGRAGAVYDAVTDRVFITIGNGVYDADRGGYNWASSVVALRPDGSHDHGTPVDSYTPANYPYLNALDLDLSSASVSILPQTSDPTLPRLGVQAGKDGHLRLLDLADLSGQGGPRHLGGELQDIEVPQKGVILTHPATWSPAGGAMPWVFVANYHGITAYTLSVKSGQPQLVQKWTRTEGGTSPVVVNNVLYYASESGMLAMDPLTGRTLWQDKGIANVHWQSPIVVNGVLYIADEGGYLAAYSPVSLVRK